MSEEESGPDRGNIQYSMIMEGKKRKTNKNNQYIAGLLASLSGFCAGTVLGWTSPALEFLFESPNALNETQTSSPPGFKISTSEEAFVGATLMLGGLLSAIPSGKFADMIGRKATLISIGMLYSVNFIVIACANNVMMLVIARFFAGLALGGCCVVTPMYIGETVEASLRGVLGSLFGVLFALGILYVNLIGIFVNWIWLSIALAVPALLSAIVILFIPDTPIYLIRNERFGKARRALMFFRGDEKVVCEELIQIQKDMAEHEEGLSFLDIVKARRYRKPLIAGLGVFIYQQYCGINVVVFYLVPILKEGGSSVSPLIAASTSNFISLIAGVISLFVIEKRNRKYFLILSAVAMLVATTGLGVFFQLKQYSVQLPGIHFLPISCVVIFLAGFAIGMGPVPWILLIELYGPEIRGFASGLNIVVSWLAAFIVTFSYPHLMQLLGSTWTFYLMSLANVLGILFIWFVVPETKGTKSVAHK